jgi:hypothetical protein
MEKVIKTAGYGTTTGFADQITLPNGKFYYTGVGSVHSIDSQEKGWECKTVEFFGACIYCNINDRAHRNFPIQVDGVSVADFLDKIATPEEGREFFNQ